ncbi:hypothetical protein A9Q99_22360 [Gammaproteobacteria bacterium 45_16_T64]|nr:hypothetical protein A9Q99_22360 [Gammaproteobacteria bacterium 45_16_T64]
MFTRFVAILSLFFCSVIAQAEEQKPSAMPSATSVNPVVIMETDRGPVEIELFVKEAPITTKNFLAYIDSGFYDGVIFHRTIPGFMVQTGGFGEDLKRKQTLPPIKNEANNGLKNTVGTLSMARTNDPHSATSQIFINVNNNASLDYAGSRNAGYAVFAKVSKGMDIIHGISTVKTKRVMQHGNVPVDPIHIVSMTRK